MNGECEFAVGRRLLRTSAALIPEAARDVHGETTGKSGV
jgi:hypothetical protein